MCNVIKARKEISSFIKCKKFGLVSIQDNCSCCAYSESFNKKEGLFCKYIED